MVDRGNIPHLAKIVEALRIELQRPVFQHYASRSKLTTNHPVNTAKMPGGVSVRDVDVGVSLCCST